MGAPSGTYEQHVFGLELRDKFLGPLGKVVRVLEQGATAWDKFESRVRGGGMDKAMAKVNGLIARYEHLEKVVNRIKAPGNIGGGSGRRSGGSVMDSHAERRKYEIWWDQQIKKQESAAQRAAERAARQQQREAKHAEQIAQKSAQADIRAQKQGMRDLADRYGFKLKHPKYNWNQPDVPNGPNSSLGGDIAAFGKTGFAGAIGAGLTVVKTAISAIVEVMKVGVEWGEKFVHTVVDAAKERGLLMTALEIQLGSREKAGAQLNKTLDIAQLTPASNRQVTDLTKRLLGAQFTGRRLDAARATWADVQAFGGDRAARQIEFWMTRTAARGEASTAGVSGIAKAGISERFIREEIAKQMGKSVGYKEGTPYTDKIDKAVRDAISQRKVNSSVFEVAVEKAVLRTLKQTELGAYSKKKGVESLAGVLSNIEEVIPTFLMRLNVDEFAGIKELKRFLTDILSFFNLGTKEGKELAKLIEDITNELLGGLKFITKDDMVRFFRRASDAAKDMVKIIGQAWDVIDKLLHGDFTSAFSGAAEAFIDIGKFIGKGIWIGFQEAMWGGQKNDAKKQRKLYEEHGIPESVIQLGASGTKANPYMVKSITDSKAGAPGNLTWIKEEAGPVINSPIYGPSLAARDYYNPVDPNFKVEANKPLNKVEVDDLSAAGVKSYAEGGTIPGPYGSPQLAIVHGGERFMGLGKGGGGNGVVIQIENLNVQVDETAMQKRFDEWLIEALDDELASGAPSS